MSSAETLPPRPPIPLVAYAYAAYAACAYAVQAEGLGLGGSAPLVVVGLALCLVFGAASRRWQVAALQALCVASLAAACGVALGGLASQRALDCAEALRSSAVSSWDIVVEGDMTETASGWRSRASVSNGDGAGGTVWLQSSAPVARGSRVRCVGRFKPLSDDEWGRSSRAQGICGTVKVVSVLSEEGATSPFLLAREALLDGLELDGGDEASREARAVAAGAVCGDSAPLKALGLDELFAACGASHLMAVSGSHLALVASLVGSWLASAGARPAAKALGTLAGTGLFVLMCGAPASAVRAWVMSAAALGAEASGRRGSSLASLCAASLAMACLDPTACGQLGFLLSVLCVGGLSLFGGYAKRLFRCVLVDPLQGLRVSASRRRALVGVAREISDSLALGVVCSVFSAPVAIPAFGRVSAIGPLCSGVLGTLFAPLMGVGALAAATGWAPWAHGASLAALGAVGSAFLWVARAFAAIPCSYAAVEADAALLCVGPLLGSVALYVAWPEPSRKWVAAVVGTVAALVIASQIRWRLFAPARVCVMDVGQADSILVTDGASSLLVDAGVDGRCAQALARNRASHLDAIVLTHLDHDHVGGLDELVGAVTCDNVYVAKGVAQRLDATLAQTIQRLSGHGAVELEYGDELVFGGFRGRVVWPREPVAGDENADSVVLTLEYDSGGRELSALLTGDAEKDETGAVIDAGDVGDVDFLKVGHHGSAISVDQKVASALRPEVSVASAGEGNSYGHPRPECVETLEAAGSVFLCTKDVGDVTVEPGRGGVSVSCAKPPVGLGE